jgi:hypothetical protein
MTDPRGLIASLLNAPTDRDGGAYRFDPDDFEDCVECGRTGRERLHFVRERPDPAAPDRSAPRCYRCQGDLLAEHTILDGEVAQAAAIIRAGGDLDDLRRELGHSHTGAQELRREAMQAVREARDRRDRAERTLTLLDDEATE